MDMHYSGSIHYAYGIVALGVLLDTFVDVRVLLNTFVLRLIQ